MEHLRDFARDPGSNPGKPLVDQHSKVPDLWGACEFGEHVLDCLAEPWREATAPGVRQGVRGRYSKGGKWPVKKEFHHRKASRRLPSYSALRANRAWTVASSAHRSAMA